MKIETRYETGQDVWVKYYNGQVVMGRIDEILVAVADYNRLEPHIQYLVSFYGNYSDDDLENDYYEECDVFLTKECVK